MRFIGRSLTGLLLLAVTLALLGAAAMLIGGAVRQSLEPGGPGRPAVERVVAANVVTLTPGEIAPVLTAYGKVEAARSLEMRTRAAGTVVWVADTFRNGLSVRKGEVLVRLDQAPAKETLAVARADLTEAHAAATEAVAAVTLTEDDLKAAEAQLQLRQQALARQKDIAARGVGSAEAVETAEIAVFSAEQAVLSRRQALASAKAAVDRTAVAVTRAEIALGEAERTLSETEIKAGLSGRVDGVGLVTGAVVGANEGLGRIIDPATLDVAVRLSTAQFMLLGQDGTLVGAPVSIVLNGAAGEMTVPGRLDRLGAAVGEGQTGRLVYVAVTPAGEIAALLQPGDFVEVRIEEPALQDAATLPALAVGRNGTLLALGPEDRLQEIAVEVLRQQGDDVIIRVGALAGREVVQERSALLGEGIRIRPIRPEAEADDQSMVPLSDARRAELIAMVESNAEMPADVKAQLLEELEAREIPAATLERLDRRMGG